MRGGCGKIISYDFSSRPLRRGAKPCMTESYRSSHLCDLTLGSTTDSASSSVSEPVRFTQGSHGYAMNLEIGFIRKAIPSMRGKTEAGSTQPIQAHPVPASRFRCVELHWPAYNGLRVRSPGSSRSIPSCTQLSTVPLRSASIRTK